MKPFAKLTHQGQVTRLREMAENALAEYDLEITKLEPIIHLENTTFRVVTPEQEYVLRINRPNHRSEAAIRSEMMWMEAIRRDTDLVVPRPIPNEGGDLVTTVAAEGVPETRHSVLFTRLDGQFYRKRISPVALERVGRFTAHLHDYVVHEFEPPAGFKRPNVEWGTEDEPGEMARLMSKGMEEGTTIIAPEDMGVFTVARYHLEQTMNALGHDPGVFNLIHADLHLANIMFYKGEARAIDFDDCGWGHLLYDLAVTQWYLQDRPDYEELYDAHLEGYRQVRSLSEDEERLLDTFRAARTLLMAMYFAGRADNPKLWEKAPQFIATCAGHLQRYMARETG